jgi:site-specific recombinase XerD
LLTVTLPVAFGRQPAAAAGFGFSAHPHMLRHACGFALAKAGHDTRRLQVGHKSINSAVRYTELDSSKFANFWPD